MSERKKNRRLRRKQLHKRFFSQNRLLVVNEETLEEVFSLRLTLVNVFVVATLGAILIIFVTTYIIAFTPLREYIPGYASTNLKKEAVALAVKTDSLTNLLQANDIHLLAIKNVLTGKLETTQYTTDSILPEVENNIQVPGPSPAENKLREEVVKEDKYNIFEQARPNSSLVFFAPVRGLITEKYNTNNKHYAVDVAVAKNTPIKAVLGGSVIFANWTPTEGNVIIIRHSDGFISVYKHAASLTKTQGDVVRSGEAIALAGSTGTASTGIHLHFELWKDGYPINPQKFITFE